MEVIVHRILAIPMRLSQWIKRENFLLLYNKSKHLTNLLILLDIQLQVVHNNLSLLNLITVVTNQIKQHHSIFFKTLRFRIVTECCSINNSVNTRKDRTNIIFNNHSSNHHNSNHYSRNCK